MTQRKLFETLHDRFTAVVRENGLNSDDIDIKAKSLTPEEAIGTPKRRDFPILTGQEVMLQASYKGAGGQAFTDAPSSFTGTLDEILALDLKEDAHNRAIFTAAMNAVMASLGRADHTIHCKTEEPEKCAEKLTELVREKYSNKKIALVGYQPSMLEALSGEFNVRVLDLSPKNVGEIRYGVKVEHGVDAYEEVVKNWADVVFVTGSTLCNGSITNFLDIGKDVVFFGITAAGAAELLGLKRFCPMSV